jgi:hypothetical protein
VRGDGVTAFIQPPAPFAVSRWAAVGHGQRRSVEREATPVTSADVFPFAERAVAVADSLLPGEAALVPRCEPHQHEGEQEAGDGSGERDVLHQENVAAYVSAVNLSFE